MSPFAGVTLLDSWREPGRYRARLRLLPESPLFLGHFPGQAILPGIAHLALAMAGVRILAGDDVALSSLRGVRFRRPLKPDDTIELVVASSDQAGTFRFELHLEAAVASSGTLEAAALVR